MTNAATVASVPVDNKESLDPQIFDQVCNMATAAAVAQQQLSKASSEAKNELLRDIADALIQYASDIESANDLDVQDAFESGMDEGLIDRLRFNAERIAGTAQGVRDVAALADPVGEIVRGNAMPNGMRLNQIRVPLGVIGMIYEARPNVTIDVATLALKSGNAVLLRGGHAAKRTNAAILTVISAVIERHGFQSALVASVDVFGRQGATAMMQARGYID
ncbi:MAG: aldehyde dehydrogenase family protein, partial [Bifidobacterium sp.]|nr:aldehyde dehydrogenase family protein [Bifidobacterium sp.]